ncbi:uncharacterized protein MYCGRDRAFT_107442 [Zymoseptoria tritici IPO323]|uniref:Uncharacterized protein n=1 Tax=Zymoseptoria tritici (strain CBS 115943 / IPO323) TaxID=336722 RepID=F9WWS3_ZYMTI|nr:uncharacterized protein MYCGRDRAFT_107442 [Zymoseptoria tritici IPO323]EGP91473.1 hypothetical protein MYCGRDRAFT_107442 [Zymoseptoria tritici IPO323]
MTGRVRRGAGGKVPIPRNYSKRQTLTDRLDGLRKAPDSERLEVFEQTAKESKAFKGFRHHAAKTQSRQDHHLRQFKDWMAMKEGKEVDDFEEEDLLEICFPRDDDGQVAENIRQFLIVTYHKTAPRSRLTGERISYRSLTKFRDSLFFWARYFAHQRGDTAPDARLLFHHAAEAMRAVIKSDPDPVPEISKQTIAMSSTLSHAAFILREASLHLVGPRLSSSSLLPCVFADLWTFRHVEHSWDSLRVDTRLLNLWWFRKSFIGLSELRVLKDFVMSTSRDIEYAEQHLAAWDIARLTACRPGSICKSGRATPLRWIDIEFQRDGETGRFKLIIHFWNLAIKKPEDPERPEAERSSDARHVELPSPEPANLTFSAAHRLLVIAIRRGILQDIDTIEDLMAYTGKNIKIKPEFREDYLFYRGKPKGMGIDMKHPLTVTALDQFLKRCCFAVGFTQQAIGMTSIRRRASSDLVARIGTEQTRRILGHAPDTFTLERYYLFMGPMMNQTGLLMDEGDDVQFKEIYRKRWAPMVTSKIDDPAIKRTRGAALRAMTDRLVLADPETPNCTTEQERRNYRARLRLHAHRALLEHEKQESEQNLTQEQFEQRVSSLEASTFADAVLKRALELRKAGDDSARFQSEGNFVPEEDDEEEDTEPEQDLESGETEVPTDGGPIRLTFESELDEEAADGDVVQESSELSYQDYATAFMDIMLHNLESTETAWKDRLDKTCPTCQEDFTVSEDVKSKEFTSQSHLDIHLASNFHTPLVRFQRMVDNEAAEHEDGLYQCPYCYNADEDRLNHYAEQGIDPPSSDFTSRAALETHVKESSHLTDGQKHDSLKEDDGWYDTVFYPKQLKSTSKKRHLKGVKELEKLGIKYTRIAALGGSGVRHKTIPGAVTGAEASGMHPRFANLVSSSSAAAGDGRLARLTVTGVPLAGLPPHVQGLVSYRHIAGSTAAGEVEDDEGEEEDHDEDADEDEDEDEDEMMTGVGSMQQDPIEIGDDDGSSSLDDDEDMDMDG